MNATNNNTDATLPSPPRLPLAPPAPPTNAPTRRHWPWLLLLLPGLFLTGLGLLAAGAGSCFLLSPEGRTLRDRVIPAVSATCDQAIEVHARPFLVSLCRPLLNWIEMDPEARTAMRALRGAEVGVYQLSRQAQPTAQTATLRAADQVMTERGWTRVVGVQKPHSLVAVYAPATPRSPRNLKLRVLVLHEKQLVLVSARGDLEALVELAWAKGDWRKHLDWSMHQVGADFRRR